MVLGGLTACGSRGDHARGWSEEKVTEVRGKVVEKISGKLDLNAEQKAKLGALADEMIASRKAFRGESSNPRGRHGRAVRRRQVRPQQGPADAGAEDHRAAGARGRKW